VVVGAIELG